MPAKIKRSIAAFLTILCAWGLTAGETVFTLGGASGWKDLESMTGLARTSGRLGQEALMPDTSYPNASFATAFATDLYLSFDDGKFPQEDSTDEGGRYRVVSNSLIASSPARAKRGTGGAVCIPGKEGLVLQGGSDTLFGKPGDSLSFTIEFWMYPAVTENGSTLFQYRSSRQERGTQLYQYIHAGIFSNRLEWKFSNIWVGLSEGDAPVVLRSRTNLVPETWSHHALAYDAETGILEYLLNGSTEDIRYMTLTGRERGALIPAIMGAAAPIEIASRFSGVIDEFRISRTALKPQTISEKAASVSLYALSGGRFVSVPIDSKGILSEATFFSAVEQLPAGTDTAYFIRAGNDYYVWTDSSPPWIPVKPGSSPKGLRGRFFQIAGELYPDGSGVKAPTVTSVSLTIAQDEPPYPPVYIAAEAGNGEVTLRWNSSIDFDVAGYLVYFGERPGEYLSTGSPVNAGKALTHTVAGLQNGKRYYFSVAAYDASGPSYHGALSPEMSARPLAVLNAR